MIAAAEKPGNIIPSVKDIYEELKFVEENKFSIIPNSKIHLKELHDGKIIYDLLQHSRWNRVHHPFL